MAANVRRRAVAARARPTGRARLVRVHHPISLLGRIPGGNATGRLGGVGSATPCAGPAIDPDPAETVAPRLQLRRVGDPAAAMPDAGVRGSRIVTVQPPPGPETMRHHPPTISARSCIVRIPR